MGLSLDELDPPLDDLAFLSRSNNRITVLRQLDSDEQTRRELREAMDISRPTLGRILTGFEDREWVSNNGSGNGNEYTLTSLGRVVFEAVTDTMTTIETVQKLRTLAPKIPFDELGLNPRDLADAQITSPSPTDATAHTRRERELLAQSHRVQFLCNQAQPETVEQYRNWVIEDGRELEAIISADAINAAMRDESMATNLDEMLRADGVTIHQYDGPVSAMLGLFEDVVSIVPLDDSGVPCALLESTNESVRSAVTDALARYRDRAEPVSV